MLAFLSLAAAAACPCRQPQDIVIVFDASKKINTSLDASVNNKLTALVEELSGHSATQITLVAFAGSVSGCEPYAKCTANLTGLTSDASTLTAAIASRSASEGDRCTSCGIETALQLLRGGRTGAAATVLLLTNGVQNIGGDYRKADSKSELLLVSAPPTPHTPHPRPDSRRSPDRPIWPTGIRVFRPWGSWTTSYQAATTRIS